MSYQRGQYNFDESTGPSNFAEQLGLTNLGLTIFPLVKKAESFDFFHNHREQKKSTCASKAVQCCLSKKTTGRSRNFNLSEARLCASSPDLAGCGNLYAERTQVLVAGACPHTYPADLATMTSSLIVRSIIGRGETGFKMPSGMEHSPTSEGDIPEDDC